MHKAMVIPLSFFYSNQRKQKEPFPNGIAQKIIGPSPRGGREAKESSKQPSKIQRYEKLRHSRDRELQQSKEKRPPH
jgi:hypothetical protein